MEVLGLDGAGGMCRVNVSRLGSHLSALQDRLCPPRNLEAPLVADLRSLLGLDLLEVRLFIDLFCLFVIFFTAEEAAQG